MVRRALVRELQRSWRQLGQLPAARHVARSIDGSVECAHPEVALARAISSSGGDGSGAVASLLALLKDAPHREDLRGLLASWAGRPPEWRPGERLWTDGVLALLATRHGVMLTVVRDRYVGRCLRLYGQFGRGEGALLSALCREGDIVVDGGANVGVHTLDLAREVGASGRVMAFEPQQLVSQMLRTNIYINDCGAQVDVFQSALGPEAGWLTFPQLQPEKWCNFGGVGASSKGLRVSMMMLDSLELATCALIKLDLEGGELGALRGATRTLDRCAPAVYYEHPEEGGVAVQRLLQDQGYSLYWHIDPFLDPENAAGNPVDQFHLIGSINVLALPPGRSAGDLDPALGEVLEPVVDDGRSYGSRAFSRALRRALAIQARTI